MMKRSLALATVAALATAMAGCGRTAPAAGLSAQGAAMQAAAAKRAAQRGGTWTILSHMSAENNLYRFGLEDLNEMEAGLPEDGSIQVYVLFDGIKNGDSCIYRIKRDPGGMNTTIVSEKVNAPEVIPANNEIDSGDVGVGVKFLQWAGKNTKADHTMVSYWDHGSGLFNGNPNPITKGFGWDDNGSNMETHDLTTLGNAFKAAAGKPLSVVGFDACLMAHGELAYQLGGVANYLVASEELEPGAGWDYKGWLSAMGNMPVGERTPVNLGKTLVSTYLKSYTSGDETTLSMVDVNAFNTAVVPALNDFVKCAIDEMATLKPAFQAARKATQVFYNSDCADLGDFVNKLKLTRRTGPSRCLDHAIPALKAAYASSIVAEGHSSHFPGATGAVLYFPTPTQNIHASYTDPNKIAFARTGWGSFLKAYR